MGAIEKIIIFLSEIKQFYNVPKIIAHFCGINKKIDENWFCYFFFFLPPNLKDGNKIGKE